MKALRFSGVNYHCNGINAKNGPRRMGSSSAKITRIISK